MLMDSPIINITIQQQDFDLATEYELLRRQSTNLGAIAIFSGLVREVKPDPVEASVCDSNSTSASTSTSASAQSLTLEHYPGMTEAALNDIVSEAIKRWPLEACRVIHRVGTLKPADQIVLVACASAHRHAAFAAAEFIMDFLKTSAPFWKKQVTGHSSAWVQSRESDDKAQQRWNK